MCSDPITLMDDQVGVAPVLQQAPKHKMSQSVNVILCVCVYVCMSAAADAITRREINFMYEWLKLS